MARPKSFDPDEALDRAMDCFWEQGYNETSVQDLVERMGVNRFSLYSTFGDKRELFLAALDRYRQTVVEPRLCALESGTGGLGDIEAFLGSMIDHVVAMDRCACLMIIAAVMEANDQACAQRVEAHCARMQRAYEAVLGRAQQLGELRAGVEVGQAASLLVLVTQGLGVMGRPRGDARSLRASVALVLDGLRA